MPAPPQQGSASSDVIEPEGCKGSRQEFCVTPNFSPGTSPSDIASARGLSPSTVADATSSQGRGKRYGRNQPVGRRNPEQEFEDPAQFERYLRRVDDFRRSMHPGGRTLDAAVMVALGAAAFRLAGAATPALLESAAAQTIASEMAIFGTGIATSAAMVNFKLWARTAWDADGDLGEIERAQGYFDAMCADLTPAALMATQSLWRSWIFGRNAGSSPMRDDDGVITLKSGQWSWVESEAAAGANGGATVPARTDIWPTNRGSRVPRWVVPKAPSAKQIFQVLPSGGMLLNALHAASSAVAPSAPPAPTAAMPFRRVAELGDQAGTLPAPTGGLTSATAQRTNDDIGVSRRGSPIAELPDVEKPKHRRFSALRDVPVPEYDTTNLPRQTAWYEDSGQNLAELEGGVKYLEAYATKHLPPNYQGIYRQYLKYRWNKPIESVDAREQKIDGSDQVEMVKWIKADLEAGLAKGYYKQGPQLAYAERLRDKTTQILDRGSFSLPEFDKVIRLYMASIEQGLTSNGTGGFKPQTVPGVGGLRDQRPPGDHGVGHFGIDAYNDGAPLYIKRDGLVTKATDADGTMYSRWQFTGYHDALHGVGDSPYPPMPSNLGEGFNKGGSFLDEVPTLVRQVHFKEAVYREFGVQDGKIVNDLPSHVKNIYFVLAHELAGSRLPEHMWARLATSQSPNSSLVTIAARTMSENGVSTNYDEILDATKQFSAFAKRYLESMPLGEGQARMDDASFWLRLQGHVTDTQRRFIEYVSVFTNTKYPSIQDYQLFLNRPEVRTHCTDLPYMKVKPDDDAATRHARQEQRKKFETDYDELVRFVNEQAEAAGAAWPHPSWQQVPNGLNAAGPRPGASPASPTSIASVRSLFRREPPPPPVPEVSPVSPASLASRLRSLFGR